MSFSAADRLLATSSPAGFAHVVSRGEWVPHEHLLLLNDRLMAAAAGEVQRLAISMPPRHGKPLYDGVVVLMGDGSRKPLSEVEEGDQLITHRGRPRGVVEVHEQGELEAVQLVTRSGRETTAALDHPFLTPRGWVMAGDLEEGSVLANVPAPATTPISPERPLEEFRLAGYFVGDGHTASSAKGASFAANITCFDPVQADDIRHCAEVMGFDVAENRPHRLAFRGRSYRDPAGPRPWLQRVGLAHKGSHTKRVPGFVMSGSPDQIGHFVGAYFACDGHINRRGGQRTDAAFECYSVNHGLLADVQHLLLRLGVRARLAQKRSTHNAFMNGPHLSWRLTIQSRDDAAKFADRVPVVGAKATVITGWQLQRTDFDGEFLPDPVERVQRVGAKPCRCLTVEEDKTFTADDLVVHNSELVSRYTPAWYLGAYPDRKVLLASYEAGFARSWGRKARDLLEEHGPDLFGVRVSESSSAADAWEIARRSGAMATAGVGGALTGKGAHLLVIDDPVKNAEEAQSQVYRDRAWDWWRSTARTRLQEGAAVILVMTRWHEDDLAGRMLEAARAGEGDEWEVLELPALAEDGDALGRPVGAPLCPELGFDTPWMTATRRALGTYWFAALYQQRPRPAEGLLFKAADFRYWRDQPDDDLYLLEAEDGSTKPVGKAWCTKFQTVDVAASEKQSADYTVIATWAATPDRALILLDVERQRFEVLDVGGMIRRSYAHHEPSFVAIEEFGHGLGVVQEMVRAGLPIRRLKPDKDKVSRALVAVARYEEHRVYHPRSAPWLREWEDELLAFPNAPHDDQADVVAYAARELAKLGSGGRVKQKSTGTRETGGLRSRAL